MRVWSRVRFWVVLVGVLALGPGCADFTLSIGQERTAVGVGLPLAGALEVAGAVLVREDSTCADPTCKNLYNTKLGGMVLLVLATAVVVGIPVLFHAAHEARNAHL